MYFLLFCVDYSSFAFHGNHHLLLFSFHGLVALAMLGAGPMIVSSRASFVPVPLMKSSDVEWYVGTWFDGSVSHGVDIPSTTYCMFALLPMERTCDRKCILCRRSHFLRCILWFPVTDRVHLHVLFEWYWSPSGTECYQDPGQICRGVFPKYPSGMFRLVWSVRALCRRGCFWLWCQRCTVTLYYILRGLRHRFHSLGLRWKGAVWIGFAEMV